MINEELIESLAKEYNLEVKIEEKSGKSKIKNYTIYLDNNILCRYSTYIKNWAHLWDTIIIQPQYNKIYLGDPHSFRNTELFIKQFKATVLYYRKLKEKLELIQKELKIDDKIEDINHDFE